MDSRWICFFAICCFVFALGVLLGLVVFGGYKIFCMIFLRIFPGCFSEDCCVQWFQSLLLCFVL